MWSLDTSNDHIYIYTYAWAVVSIRLSLLVSIRLSLWLSHSSLISLVTRWCLSGYGVATIGRLLQIIGLFCKRALYKRPYSAKETFSFKEPTSS